MPLWILQRLGQAVIVVIIVSLFAFSLVHLVPGDPALTVLGRDASPLQVQQLRHEFGLDLPLPAQLKRWYSEILSGNFGQSIAYREAVAGLISKRLPITVLLGVSAFVVAAILGIAAGLIAAIYRGRIIDTIIGILTTLGLSVPLFWLGVLGIYLFALQLGWLPAQGYTSPLDDPLKSLRQLTMPVLCLAVVPLAAIARQTRSATLEAINQDYVRTAWSKGLSRRTVYLVHVLRNSLIPVVALMGVHLTHLLGGSVLIESVFNIPGMGRLLVRSVFDKDFPVVQASVLVFSILVVGVNLLTDIVYGIIDHRVRHI